MTTSKNDQLEKFEKSLTNHTPTDEQVARIENIRDRAKLLASDIIHTTPQSREQSLALTHLEDSVMWAVKSIVLEGR